MKMPATTLLLLSLGAASAPAQAASVQSAREIAPGTSEDPVFVRELAEGRYLDGELESAAQLYFEVARLTSDTAERSNALLNAAWLQLLLGERDDTLSTLRSALRVDPDIELDTRLYNSRFEKIFLEARSLSAPEVAATPPPIQPTSRVATPNPARRLYDQGVERQRQGDGDAALGLLQRAAAMTYADDSSQLALRRTALLRIGLLYFERSQFSDAATAFEEAVGLDRSDVSAWKNLGLARSKEGDRTAAIEAFREAYARQPGALENARNLAQALVRDQRWDDAVSWISDAVRHHERDAHLRLLLAESQKARGAQDRAAESWRAAMELDDSFEWEHGRQAAIWLGVAHLEAGRNAEAASVSREALERDPRDATFWNLIGLAQQADGEAAVARESFRKACEHDERRAEYRNNLGRAYAAVGDLAEAEREFVYALTLEPDLPAAQSNLAQVRKLLSSR